MDKDIMEKIEKEIEEELAKENILPDMFGYISAFEKRKKEILKEKYNTEYITILEKNNGCSID